MRATQRRLFGTHAVALAAVLAVAPPRAGAAERQAGDPKPAAPTQAPAPSAPQAASPAPAARDRREDARQNAEKALRASMVPAPMSRERFAAFLAAIDPALAANADLAAQYATYAEQSKAAIDANATKIGDRLPAAYTFDAAREVFVARANPELVQALVLRDKTEAQVRVAERALLRAVLLATPAERRLRYLGERLAWIDERTPREGLLASTPLTLLELIARARVSPESLAAAEPILVAHAERLVALRESRNAALADGDLRRARIETDAGTLWRLGPAERAGATDALLAAVDDAEFAGEIAIRELHFETLKRLRTRLNAQEGRRVVEEWQRAVHPELFDDERLLSRLVAGVIALPSSTAEADEAILDAVDTAYRKLEPLAREASTAADLVLPRLPDRSDASIEAEIKARLAVIAVQAKRRVAIRDVVARVRGIAATGDAAAIAQFESVGETLSALERADAFDRASLESLARALAARAEEARAAEQGNGEVAATAPTTPQTTPQTTPPAAPDRAKPSDTRAPAADRDGNGAGSRSGRGSRRQQDGPARP